MAARKSKAPPPGTESGAGADDGVPDLSGGEGAEAGASSSEGATGAEAASTDAPAADAGTVETSETRIKDAAKRKLEEKTGNQAVLLSQSEARANGLEGELKRERGLRSAAEAKVTELTAQLAAATTAARNAGTAISGLPDNARQLNECVTVHVLGRGGTTPRRAQVKASDVLLVTRNDDELDELQQTLGLQATVYKVSKETLADLEESGFLHK